MVRAHAGLSDPRMRDALSPPPRSIQPRSYAMRTAGIAIRRSQVVHIFLVRRTKFQQVTGRSARNSRRSLLQTMIVVSDALHMVPLLTVTNYSRLQVFHFSINSIPVALRSRAQRRRKCKNPHESSITAPTHHRDPKCDAGSRQPGRHVSNKFRSVFVMNNNARRRSAITLL